MQKRRAAFKTMTAEQRLQVARDAAKGPVERAEPYQISGPIRLPELPNRFCQVCDFPLDEAHWCCWNCGTEVEVEEE